MTHLYIEQDTGSTEEVTSAIISKLYELAISGNLDNTSDLKGRLHSTAAREDHITYFSTHYPDLYITADKQYISFADPIIENYLKSTWGDGVGVQLSDAANYTVLSFQESGSQHFENNTQITSFNELGRFKTIKEIAKSCFRSASNLAYIDLSNIEIMGHGAFYGTDIRTLNLPNLKSFKDHRELIQRGGGEHFRNCKSLTQVTIGPYLQDYLTGAWFEGCTALTDITIQSSIDELPGNFCYGCSSLINANIDWSGVTFRIGENALRGCSNWEQNNLTLVADELGNRCFAGCKKLTGKITINNSTCIIGTNVFEGCTGLTSAQFSGNTSLGNSMFYQCSNLQSVTGLSNVTSLNNHVFDQCTNLTSIDIDQSKIVNIGEGAFCRCNSLSISTLNVPNLEDHNNGSWLNQSFLQCQGLVHVINLGRITKLKSVYGNDGTFYNCQNLEDITLPETLTEIGLGSFNNCPKMRWIKILSTQLPTYNRINGFGNTNTIGISFGESWRNDNPSSDYQGATYPIYVKDDLLSQYQAADGWKYVGPNRLRSLSQFATDFPNG